MKNKRVEELGMFTGDLRSSALTARRVSQITLVLLGLVAAAILLPALAHQTGAPVRWLLPMHWPVVFAGLMLGWRSGLLVGLLAPATNYLLTGYPLPMVLPAMTLELAVYGFLSGWLTQRLSWNSLAATGLAIVAGRLVFIATVLITGGYQGEFTAYLIAAMLPGLTAGAMQAVLLPPIVRLVSRSGH